MENRILRREITKNITILFLTLINISCNKYENNFEKKSVQKDSLHFDYSNFKRTTYEKAKEIFLSNEEEIKSFTLEFQKQDDITRISRDDYSQLEIDSVSEKFFPGESKLLSYSIKFRNSKNNSIFITEEFKDNEDEFWAQDFSEINTSENISLKNFLEKNQFSQDYFNKIIKFFNKYKFFSIRKILGGKIIEIRIRISDGIIYNSTNEKSPELSMYVDIEPISSSWFYFTEFKKY